MPKSLEFQEKPAIFLGGTGARERDMRLFYGGIDAKLIALPDRGLDKVENTYSQLRDTVLAALDGVEDPIVLGGHSQGGIHALRLSLDPELKGRVVNTLAVASPSRGFSENRSEQPLGALLIKKLYGDPPAIEGMLETSDFIMGLGEAMKDEWPQAAKLSALVPAGDRIVPSNIQLGLELPIGQEVHEILHGRPRQVKQALARAAMAGIATEDIETKYGRFPSGHVLAARGFRRVINTLIQEYSPEHLRVA